MRLMLFDCFSGISGDMTLGALLDLGLPFAHLQQELSKISVTGYKITFSGVSKNGISAVKFDVMADGNPVHRHLQEILDIINNSELSSLVKNIASKAFRRLAEAEGKIHNIDPEKVHFHEVGGVDAIVDIVGSSIGIEYFSPDHIFNTPLPMGKGIISTAHGLLPVPAPATLELLKDQPIEWTSIEGERVTPTGAAILTSLLEIYKKNETLPPFKVDKIGYGAGSKEFPDRPNLLRIILGNDFSHDYKKIDSIEIIETNIDDMNPQIYEHLFARLYSAGAGEVFIVPVIMKKSRPGSLLTVLCKKDLVNKITDIIFHETSTAGIRLRSETRYILDRQDKVIETEFGPIRVKILKLHDKIKIQPEYDDCAGAAARHNLPLLTIIDQVRRQAEFLEGMEK